MSVRKINGSLAIVHLQLKPSEIAGLLSRHAEEYPGAQKLERQGASLVKNKFRSDRSVAFVRAVCEWGRGHRNVDRVLDRNTPQAIAGTLQYAHKLCLDGHVTEAVEHICGLAHLRQSFGSKQLRFLAPTKAVILDEVIRSRLGYPQTISGYNLFLFECQAILAHLMRSNGLPGNPGAALRICDVETAIFAKLQGY